MEKVYSHELTVTCYDVDSRFRLRPASFMNMAQEVAQCHATTLGYGYDDLMESRTVWVLSRLHVRFMKYPLWRDKVKISTWHKGMLGLFYLRDFEMTDKDGTPLIVANSSWLVLNIDTRHLARETEITAGSTRYDRDALERACNKIHIPSGVERVKVGERVATYSDIDMNSHANNVSYLVWVMDCIDYDFLSNHELRELSFNFNAEVHPYDKVELYRYNVGDKIYFEGVTADRQNFTLELLFEEI